MQRFRKHIALLLFGIVFGPVTFQSIHIVQHYAQSYQYEAHICHSEVLDGNHKFKKAWVITEEQICTICTYEFPVNELPKVVLTFATYSELISTHIENGAYLHSYQGFSENIPRAPPIPVS